MKSRFTTIDIRAAISQLRGRLAGMRVVNVYDIDNKTYLIRFAKPDQKAMLLMESGIRIHSTEFDWPKNMVPSGFSMKLRKHLRGRRLEKLELVGIDRIVDLQFGSGEAAYHIILELYDRGNIVLTDCEYVILNILRPRANESQDVRFAVRERYPLETARQPEGLISQEQLTSILLGAKEGENLKKVLNPHLVYGPAVIQHALLVAGIPENARLGKEFHLQQDISQLLVALQEAERLLELSYSGICKGYVIQKSEKKPVQKKGEEPEELLTYAEFHPFLYRQNDSAKYMEFDSFDKSVDEFFSNIGTQKLDMKALQQEKSALKKLDNVKRDHEKRVEALRKEQDSDTLKAKLIEMNDQLVDQAVKVVQSALANQIDWTEIANIVKEAQARDDPVANAIKGLKLETNHVTMLLKDPFGDSEDEEDGGVTLRPMKVDIDLGLTTYANARRYYDMKRHAAKKEQKTLESSGKALKSAEKKTKQTLKEVQTAISIQKARKTYWFEKFLWFISSENYIVIGGRDQQQNEIVVKKYLRPGDLYVHADLHGASSVIIKNRSGGEVPPKTLNEAGTMAICNSAAWDAKVVTSAWWVRHDQVSKTAPTGEYLSTGSFMVRGKKNFLPPSYLIYGFAFLFKLEDASVPRHKGERRVRTLDDDSEAITEPDSVMPDNDVCLDGDSSSDGDNGEKESVDEKQLSVIEEDDGTTRLDTENDSVKTEQGLLSAEDVVGHEDGEMKAVDERQTELTTKERMATESNLDSGVVKSEQSLMPDTSSTVADTRVSDDIVYPDTSIELQHVKGNKFKLQRNVGRLLSTGSQGSEGDEEEQIFLGDDQPVKLGEKAASSGRISAKQRREMKKRAKLAARGSEATVEKDWQLETKEPEMGKMEGTRKELEKATEEEEAEDNCELEGKNEQQQQRQQQQQLPPAKRGQKAKQRKIKEKYKDQDEEERRLKMEILASAGVPKVDQGKKKKGKKGQTQDPPRSAGKQQQQQQTESKQTAVDNQLPGRRRGPLTVEDITTKPLTTDKIAADGVSLQTTNKKEEGEFADDKEEEDNVAPVEEDADVLDTLTGLPVAEDELLFCIPVAAPYSVLINYKYKVKLTPGNTKRGKAAKTAINMFSCDRSATIREKEMFKSLKDVDMSRNIPGKVKVSAPNLHRQKKH